MINTVILVRGESNPMSLTEKNPNAEVRVGKEVEIFIIQRWSLTGKYCEKKILC